MFDLLLPVTPNDIGSRNYMSSELSDPGNIGVAVGISTIHSVQAYIQCTSDSAAAILDLLLPVTSGYVGSMYYMSSELSDLGIMGVAIGTSTT